MSRRGDGLRHAKEVLGNALSQPSTCRGLFPSSPRRAVNGSLTIQAHGAEPWVVAETFIPTPPSPQTTRARPIPRRYYLDRRDGPALCPCGCGPDRWGGARRSLLPYGLFPD